MKKVNFRIVTKSRSTLVKYLSFSSGAMLRINAEPSFFTEIFTELKSVGAQTEYRS